MTAILGNLPFPRGKTWSDFGNAGLTLDDDTAKHLEGREYWVLDSEHNSGQPVKLRVVKNDTGSTITPSNQLLRFSTSSIGDFGCRIAGTTNSAGMVCVPIDDAYESTPTIPDDDLFYVVMEGRCAIAIDGANCNVTVGESVTCDNAGAIGDEAATAGQFTIGALCIAAGASDTTETVLVDIQLKKPPESG